MPDPITSPTTTPPAATPPAKPKTGSKSPVNKQHLAELQLATAVAAAAVKAEYAPLLAKRDITAEFVTALLADLTAAQTLTGQATGKTAAKVGVTSTETDLKDALIAQLQEVQKAVKQKSVRTKGTALLKRYAVGSKFYSSRAALEQTAESFLENLKTDTLPGVDAAVIAGIKFALAAYRGAETDQSDAQSQATKGRTALETAVAEIALRRREIQLAADAAWPAGKKANAATRVEFGLSADKALR